MSDGFPMVAVLFAVIFVVVSLGMFLFVARASGMRLFDVEMIDEGPEDVEDGESPRVTYVRPWWGNPLFWFAVGTVSLLLGLFVAPHFFGGAVVFLPFLWIGGGRRR